MSCPVDLRGGASQAAQHNSPWSQRCAPGDPGGSEEGRQWENASEVSGWTSFSFPSDPHRKSAEQHSQQVFLKKKSNVLDPFVMSQKDVLMRG